jgi:RNA polymerase sigma-70 factor (ECF subfamily)
MVSIHPHNNEEEHSSFEIADASPDPELQVITKELKNKIEETVASLNEKQRTVLILKDYLDKSYEEISDILEMNIGTVKSTLSRGRLNVAKKIREYQKL